MSETTMSGATKVLVILLRLLGATGLLAVGAVLMPSSWMADIHRWLGLGELPAAPIVEYLARSLSAFYAFFGALCLLAASDVERYRPLVRFLGMALVLMGIVFVGIDLVADMPLWWTLCEGPPGLVLGVLLDLLAHPNRRGSTTP